MMRTLNHRNIMNLNEVFETENNIYLVLDYIKGYSLYDRLNMK